MAFRSFFVLHCLFFLFSFVFAGKGPHPGPPPEESEAATPQGSADSWIDRSLHMTQSTRIAFACLFAALLAGQSFAADGQPLLAKPGKVLFEDDFARSDMKPKWRLGKGTWAVKDGVASAMELPDDHHAAYAYIVPNVEYKNIVAEYSFRLDAATKIHLMMEDNKYKGAHAGHII